MCVCLYRWIGRGGEAGLRGRDADCALLDDLVWAIRQGESRALVPRGEAGIGKTSLLEYLVGSASGAAHERLVELVRHSSVTGATSNPTIFAKACWAGHFGEPNRHPTASTQDDPPDTAIKTYVDVAGPVSQLWQAENGHLNESRAPFSGYGVCEHGASGAHAPEQAALGVN